MLKDTVKGFAQRPPVTMGTWARPPALPWQQAPPRAPAGAHQSVQVAPSWERGAGGRWGATTTAWACPATPHPRAPRPRFPSLRVPYLEGVTSHDKATSARPRSSTDTLPLPDRPAAVPGDPEGTVNTQRPARCPRKCWAASKPRPTLPLAFSGIVRRRPPWLRSRCSAIP